MENIYTVLDIIPTSSADCTKKIRFSAVLGLMQDAAYEHARQLGAGYEVLIAQHRAFVLSRI